MAIAYHPDMFLDVRVPLKGNACCESFYVPSAALFSDAVIAVLALFNDFGASDARLPA